MRHLRLRARQRLPGVWHLNEDGNTTAGGYADATGNGYNGTGRKQRQYR